MSTVSRDRELERIASKYAASSPVGPHTEHCTALYCTALYCTVLYCTVPYRTVLYCTVVQVVLMRTNPEVTNNHLIVCLGEDTPPVRAV